MSNIQPILDRVLAGERMSVDECRQLLESHDIARMGRLAHKTLNVFTIETTVNNRMFDKNLDFLYKNEDDLSGSP